MSPKEYFSLLFKCFFKGISFRKEVDTWTLAQKEKTILWANLYHALLIFILAFVVSRVCYLYHIHFNISASAAVSIFIPVFVFILVKSFKFLTNTISTILILLFMGIMGIGQSIILGIYFTGIDAIFFSIILGIITGSVWAILGNYLKSTPDEFFKQLYYGLLGSFILGGLLGLGTNSSFNYIFFFALLVSCTFFPFYLLIGSRFLYYFFSQPLYKKSNPLWWDENISISVPFLPNILRGYAKTKDFDKTIEFAKFLIEERPIQSKAAQEGLILIALDRMKGFNSIERIMNLIKELSFLPIAYTGNITFIRNIKYVTATMLSLYMRSKEVDTYLSNLDKKSKEKLLATFDFVLDYNAQLQYFIVISEDLNKTWNELNNNNRISIYERIKHELIDYCKATNLSNSIYAKAFSEVADAWQKVLTQTIDELRSSGKLPIANPYTLGKALDANSEQFLGRRDIIQKIETETLREGAATALLFVGNRRTGKSSTLNNLQRFVQSAVRTVFVDMQDAEVNNSTADFCETLTERIAKSLKIRVEQPIRDLAAFTKWLKQCDADLVRDNRYLLICLDEYERLEGLIQNGKLIELPNTLRHWIQHLQHIVFLLAGSHEPEELKGTLDWTDYLINVRNVPISYLEYDAALQLVTNPVPHFDLTWASDDLAEKLVLRLGRQPYLLQCTMWNLVEGLNNQSRKEATQADIESALDKILEGDARNHFAHFWHSEMTDAARHILSNLARNTQPTEGAVLNGLKRKEILKLEDNVYVFCVPLLKEWILRNVDAVTPF